MAPEGRRTRPRGSRDSKAPTPGCRGTVWKLRAARSCCALGSAGPWGPPSMYRAPAQSPDYLVEIGAHVPAAAARSPGDKPDVHSHLLAFGVRVVDGADEHLRAAAPHLHLVIGDRCDRRFQKWSVVAVVESGEGDVIGNGQPPAACRGEHAKSQLRARRDDRGRRL